MESTNSLDASYLNKSARRQLTVLFCDLVGSVETSEKLDVEDWLEFLKVYQGHCKTIIEKYDGHIAQYLGDGLLVYFGYPVAHENSPHSAVTAALEILKNSARIEDEIRASIESGQDDVKLEMRIAIHTGPVVMEGVGEQKDQNYLALGVVPAIAARLQDKALPNTVVVSEDTYALVHSAFNCELLGDVALKGISGTQKAYLIRSDRGVHTRFEAACEAGLTSFVSRDEEIALLNAAWQQARKGLGRLVLLKGDPGIGKSRLIKEFADRYLGDDCVRLSCQCSPYHKDSALYPLIVMVQSLLGIAARDSEEVKLGKISASIEKLGALHEEFLPMLAGLLSVSLEQKYPELSQSARRSSQQDYQEFFSRWIMAQAGDRPIYLLVEDYHWVDPSTEDFLKHLVSLAVNSNMLVVITHRPEVAPPWSCGEHVSELALGPLPSLSVEAMIRKMWSDASLSAALINQIIESTDGVPLFIEESIIMARNQGEDEGTSGAGVVIPATLQDLLLARLDRVGEAKHVAQLAATIGREFSYEILATISPYEQDRLESLLNQLIAAGLLCVVEGSEDNSLYFKHALIRDIAYQSLLVSQTKKIHKALSAALCEQFPEYRRTQPEIIAYHLTRAASYLEAIEYWKLAGRRAIGLHAHLEAVAHLEEALKLVEKLPDDDERKQIELELNTLLGGRMIVTRGYGADEVGTYYSRALQLAQQLGNQALTQKILFGLEGFHFIRGDFDRARDYLNKCLLIATRIDDTDSILKVNWSLGEVFFHLGDQLRCQSYLEKCLSLYSEAKQGAKVLQDPGVMGHIYMSWTKWMSGFPEQSMQSVHAAVSLAEKIDHPLSKTIAYCMYGGVNLFRGEYEQALKHADTAIEICEERGFQFWQAYSLAVRGRALVSLGRADEGIAEIREGLRRWEASGTMVTRPYYRSLLAESLEIAGETEAACAEAALGLEAANATGEGYYLTEVYRLFGELSHKLAGGDGEKEREAERSIQQAIDLAREQGAKSFELRAEISMARVRGSKGETEEKHAALRAVYDWFTEGLETQDLQQARQILESKAP